jgi:hypothetical protein
VIAFEMMIGQFAIMMPNANQNATPGGERRIHVKRNRPRLLEADDVPRLGQEGRRGQRRGNARHQDLHRHVCCFSEPAAG